ncbi:hypothetical protein J2X77_004404 [Sphingobacterium sp. 2149]|nr:hypothetical protein [Sphingobacterium sp. 2149]
MLIHSYRMAFLLKTFILSYFTKVVNVMEGNTKKMLISLLIYL